MIYAKYTVVLKSLLDEPLAKSEIDKALASYPIYEPTNEFTYSVVPKRSELNEKLLNHYKYREIGFETVGRFIDELKIAMNEIMPYYNQLMKSQDVLNGVDDVFGNVDITESFEEITSGEAKGNVSNDSTTNTKSDNKTDMTNNSKNVKSETPGDSLTINAKEIDNVTYADNITWNEDISSSTSESNDEAKTNSESTSTSEQSGTTQHTLTRKGNQGVNTYAHDLKELRETFINIEQMIINDKRIRELFMLVY